MTPQSEFEHTPDRSSPPSGDDPGLAALSDHVRSWFLETYQQGPTPAQSLGWPAIASRNHTLLISPTGSGKTLAAFLAIIDGLVREWVEDRLERSLRCIYLSPLRSLGYDVERNLLDPLHGIARRLGLDRSPISVGVRTGDTSAYHRRRVFNAIPHILITTPESLSLLLSQPKWRTHWRTVERLIVDEIHSLVPTKRGADLACTLERLSAQAERDPSRIGLSATCRPSGPVAEFLVGPFRTCSVIDAPPPEGSPDVELQVSSLIRADEAPHRGLTYRRVLRRLRQAIRANRTTVVFANTRALTEKMTHDLRNGGGIPRGSEDSESEPISVAAHHSALDADRRREVESALKDGSLRSVITSTSLELGVDIGTADLTVQIGLPGGVSRYLQRVGRSGHRRGATTRGLILAATPAEIAGAIVTSEAAFEGRIEPLKPIRSPLDVLCQQLVGMACSEERSIEEAFALLRRTAPMAELSRADFDSCLSSLAGELAAPAGAFEPEPGAAPRWTSPRIWKRNGWFGIRSSRVVRWFWTNVGTIHSEESLPVVVDGQGIGYLESSYAERLSPGDRFVLDGRALVFRRLFARTVTAEPSGGEPNLPRWSSDRQSLSPELASELGSFRNTAARLLLEHGPIALRAHLLEDERRVLDPDGAAVLIDLLESQEQRSEIPPERGILVEESPATEAEGWDYSFHAPLNRAACEALARAVSARLGRRIGRDLELQVADLGWSIRVAEGCRLDRDLIETLLSVEGLEEDVIAGIDRGALLAGRFRNIASTALLVLRNPEPGRRVRVGGMNWVSERLYPLIKAATPDHPLLRETRREVLEDLLDLPRAEAWLASKPEIRFRSLPALSPFALAWLAPGRSEPLAFESPTDALRRLHQRLTAGGA
jgi:ATP-dependent Lhr-like helicase